MSATGHTSSPGCTEARVTGTCEADGVSVREVPHNSASDATFGRFTTRVAPGVGATRGPAV